MIMRLQKILADRGVASRRKAEEIIEEGRVTVNGVVATLGDKADPEKDHIKLDGKLLSQPAGARKYMVLHKPKNVITTLDPEETRPTVRDFLAGVRERVYPVGRLDFDSEGLLLLTNDGELAHAVMHPSGKMPKTYRVKIKGVLEEKDFEKLRRGVRLDDGLTAPAEVRPLEALKQNSWIEMTIYEGRKRQIRRMLQAVGHPVIRLIRTRIDGLSLGSLAPGEMRHLSNNELKRLKYSAGLSEGG
ncbi:MAG: pseudouridine synthase [Nitrospirota bacterium]